ncbi:hypothetical protein BGX33_006293 [Mortierella sp. NVP41]|nr:hypothetical protein BGX33_006293 [Mortierella sp. NVP41]
MYYSEKDKRYNSIEQGKGIIRFDCQWYQMSFENRVIKYLWFGPTAFRYRSKESMMQKLYSQDLPQGVNAYLIPGLGVRQTSEIEEYCKVMKNGWEDAGFRLRWLRNNGGVSAAWDSCWHCTWCHRNSSGIAHKLKSYIHQENNHEEFKTLEWIVTRKRDGTDIINLERQPYNYFADNKDVPHAVNEDREKYDYLLHAHGMPNSGGRAYRMIDIIHFNNDLDQLQLRLKENNGVVDVFVILESSETLSGPPKPLYYHENREMFKYFAHKIIYIEMSPRTEAERKEIEKKMAEKEGWEPEDFERSKTLKLAFEQVKPVQGDWFIISSLEEIPTRNALVAILHSHMEDQGYRTYWQSSQENGEDKGNAVIEYGKDIYRMPYAYYQQSYDRPSTRTPLAIGSNATTATDFLPGNRSPTEMDLYRHISENNWEDAGNRIRELRNNEAINPVQDSCWYCSYCKRKLSQVIELLEENKKPEDPAGRTTAKWVVNRARDGLDLFGRSDVQLEYLKENWAVPVDADFHGGEYPHLKWRHGADDAKYEHE